MILHSTCSELRTKLERQSLEISALWQFKMESTPDSIFEASEKAKIAL